MKSLPFILLLAITTITLSAYACTNSKENTNTSKEISVINYEASSFDSIDAEIIGNIIFTQNEKTSVRAEATQKEIDNIIVSFDNGTLKLRTKNKRIYSGNNKRGTLKVYISSPNIASIKQEGVGVFTLKDKVTSNNLNIDYEGVGNLIAEDLKCENLIITYKGVGNIKLKGSAVNAKYISEGVGSTNAEKLDAEHLIVRASGVGSVKCRASKTIEIYSEGVGGVTYWGKPQVKKIVRSGVGKLKSDD